MIVTQVLNFLHQLKCHRLLCWICTAGYFFKGHRKSLVRYHAPSRSYSFLVDGITYMSLGPGWAYSYSYLKNLLNETYCSEYLPGKGACVVDIGAGLGEESLVIAQLIGANGKLFSVEANPKTFQGLQFACEANQFSWVTPLNVALFERDEMVSIEDDTESYIGNTIQTSPSISSFQVRGVTFDTFVKENKIESIDFLKLNIEGAEQFLLKSSQSIRLVKNACISCHDFRNLYHQHGEFYMTKEKIKTFFIANGFEITIRNTGNVVVDDFIYARLKDS